MNEHTSNDIPQQWLGQMPLWEEVVWLIQREMHPYQLHIWRVKWDYKSSQLIKAFIGLVELDSPSPASNITWSDNSPSCRKYNIIDYCDS